VSDSRKSVMLLRFYPPAWRARYGDELAALIEQNSEGGRVSWRVRLDVVSAGVRERLRAVGLAGDGVPPGERVPAGSLLVLCAWVLFVVAGAGVQKVSEHWQDVTPAAKQGLPSLAFGVLVGAAGLGSALVLIGIAAALPSLAAYLRGGGWSVVRRPIVRAVLVSLPTVAATIGLVVWARRLSNTQRNGGDFVYGGVFLLWVLLVAACLLAWTVAAVATARRLSLSISTLRIEAWLALAVSGAMAAMTIATAVWWASLADAAPWFFTGLPVGSAASPFDPKLAVAAALMLCATLVAFAGATRAVRGLPKLTGHETRRSS
jgi:hypothetical protein